MEFTVKRSEWAYGGAYDKFTNEPICTSLLDENGYKCCLGFFGLACGLEPADIKDHYYPYELRNKYPEWAGLRIIFNDFMLEDKFKSGDKLEDVEIISLIAKTNDDEDLPLETKETRLKQLFAMKDIVINFED